VPILLGPLKIPAAFASISGNPGLKNGLCWFRENLEEDVISSALAFSIRANWVKAWRKARRHDRIGYGTKVPLPTFLDGIVHEYHSSKYVISGKEQVLDGG